ncbi:MAG TPA: GNAT family N-acetyltransferase [Kofleriaceae bacterium]|jgi:RimJ/RimL family protein N-acetyltransferase
MTAPVQSETLVDSDRVVIRPLTAADSEAYRRLRQSILEIGEGKFFSSSYTREQQLTTEAQWREWCTETPVRCTIGSFVDGELVGSTGIVQCGDPASRTVEWNATWMAPKYRRSGIAKRAREAVRAWSRAHGYRYAITDIRADNTLFREIREREGAMYLCTERDVTWADGSKADAHYFLLNLSPGAEIERSAGQAVAFVKAALAFLTQDAHGDPEP